MTTHAPVPEWLALWREQQGVSARQQPVAAPSTRERRTRGADGLGFVEPRQWPWDGGTRREPVLDADRHPPRVVRHVGWRSCLRCSRPFFSADVARVRMCDPCKEAI
ncbi:hypothetical protein SPDO_22180 [Sphingomonas dokdonensis]|uniref:Uncharacterized protein n=1 Tax=Sphingomonas dokdonensis TaxID=344880 RepID=A0A245ZHM4_9SPHN|nr:hypothetical protein SPDO_22180 [Sphingomonas dokdonensis]